MPDDRPTIRRCEPAASGGAPTPTRRPSQHFDADSPAVQAMLEELDDAVFAALKGCPESLETTRRLWPQVVSTLGWELVDESREQYLRFAVETTIRRQEEEIRSPERSVAALEILSLLAR